MANNGGSPSCSCSCSCFTLLVGLVVAVCMSWMFNHSVWWAIFHGCLNWLYVAYKTIAYVVTNY